VNHDAATEREPTLHLQASEVIVRPMLTYDRAADDHLGDCARRGFTPRTLSTYGRTYKEFGDRLPRDQDVSKVTTDDVRRYLATKAHLAPGTVAGCEAHLASLFRQLYLDGRIARDPMDRLLRTKRHRPEDLDVVSVDTVGVRRILTVGVTWPEKLAPAVPAYLGPRRRAIASLRLADYDRDRQRMRFKEKGGKTIWKPVPGELARLIQLAEAYGAYERYDYIVPPEGSLQRVRPGQLRDDRVIWRVIRRLADRAGVDCHVHALRAAFACFYDECNPGDVLALRDLMGHASVRTTELYLRRRDKEAGMERVRSLSWGVASSENVSPSSTSQIAGKAFASSPVVGAGGFEPPSADTLDGEPRGGEHDAPDVVRRKLDALREGSPERGR
jgi:integrase